MDKQIPAQKASSLTERFPLQLCRHNCRYLTWINCFQLYKRKMPAEAPQETWPFRMCLFCHWIFAGGETQSIYPHTNDCLFPFPSTDFKEIHNWTSENFNICIRLVQLLIKCFFGFFFIRSHWHHKVKTWKGKTQQPLCWFSHWIWNNQVKLTLDNKISRKISSAKVLNWNFLMKMC